MRKFTNLYFLLLAVLTVGAQKNDVTLSGGANLTVGANSVLYVKGGKITVPDMVGTVAAGTLTVQSSATHSGTLITDNGVTGKMTYERFVSHSSATLEWSMAASPVAGQNIKSFVDNASNSIRSGTSNSLSGVNRGVAEFTNTNKKGFVWLYYNETPITTFAAGELNQKTLTGNFTSGEGYAFSRNGAGKLSFTGTYVNADVNVPILKALTGGGGGSHHAIGIVGNPYPYYLPLNNNTKSLLKNNATKLPDNATALYIWDRTLDRYKIYNYTEEANSYLAPGQAFFIRSKSPSAVSNFTFTKADASHIRSGASNLFRKGGVASSIDLSVSDGVNTASTSFKFEANGTTGLDKGYDAVSFTEGIISRANKIELNSRLVSNSLGEAFALQVLPPSFFSTQGSGIPLSVTSEANKTLSFSMSSENLASDVNVYIEDSKNNTFTKINSVTYTTTTTTALNDIGRFYLHSINTALNVEDLGALSHVNLYKKGENTIRITGLGNGDVTTLSLYSVSGKKVFSSNFNSQRVKDVEIPSNLSTGIYIAKVNSANKDFNKKIIIE